MLASSPQQVLLMKDLVNEKSSSKIRECMKVEISSNVKFLGFTRGEK